MRSAILHFTHSFLVNQWSSKPNTIRTQKHELIFFFWFWRHVNQINHPYLRWCHKGMWLQSHRSTTFCEDMQMKVHCICLDLSMIKIRDDKVSEQVLVSFLKTLFRFEKCVSASFSLSACNHFLLLLEDFVLKRVTFFPSGCRYTASVCLPFPPEQSVHPPPHLFSTTLGQTGSVCLILLSHLHTTWIHFYGPQHTV